MVRSPLRSAIWVALVATPGCNAIFGIHEGTPLPEDPAVDPETVVVPAAGDTFHFDLDGLSATATLTHAFAIDRHEVTVGRFRAWVESGRDLPCDGAACSLDPGGPYELVMTWDPGWNDSAVDVDPFSPLGGCTCPVPYSPTSYNRGDPELPMTCVSWHHAAAFCASEGKRLPTEVEWQYVATGHGDGRIYPFTWSGEPFTCDLVTYLGTGDGCGFPVPGGSAPGDVSRDGLVDLGGSVFEWVWDVSAPFVDDTTDYAGPAPSGDPAQPRVRRGGAFISPADDWRLRTDSREAYGAVSYYSDAGFRCAKTILP
ncbi:MAG: SUMF1/EgtB/PvdO family nonheme iron enzyme [Polyangiaceae bacterium]|nr:SUMF1/EgtB/PvdO family nonheme iron enzyme [Polyangiaceae bacterium]